MSGVSFTVDIDTSDLERAWAKSLTVLSDGIRQGVADGVTEGAQEARTVHRYKDRTGALTASTVGRVEVSAPGGAVGVIEATKPYASFVEEGTAAHEIRPKLGAGVEGPLQKGQRRRGRGAERAMLHWEDDNGHHFARKVNHPGTPSLPFIGPAVLKAERVIVRDVEVAIAKVATIMDE